VFLVVIVSSNSFLHCIPPSPKILSTFYFLNNSLSRITDFNDFWYVKSWENLTSKAYKFAHLTCQLQPLYPEKSKKSFSTILLIRTSNYLRYLRIKRTVTVTMNWPTISEKCNRTILWNTELVHLIEGILFSSKCWCIEKSRLWYVATNRCRKPSVSLIGTQYTRSCSMLQMR